MRKRIITLLLILCLTVSAVMPAFAAGSFADISDSSVANAVEVLRLAGILGGFPDGTFRPTGNLTRAQFCKMAVYAMVSGGEAGKYSTVTVFPDVKPSHWASDYVNLAAKGKHIIGGFPDGKFHPDENITAAQAVTIILRVLGYTDEAVGGVWPDGYMATAKAIGLLDNTDISVAGASITRAQAAKMFMNMLQVKGASGSTLYTACEETTLTSVDAPSGKMKTSDGTYQMVCPTAETSLRGASGRVILTAEGKALTFIPTVSYGSITDAAVVISSDGSAGSIAALAGKSGYKIIKNGIEITASDLKKNDVAVYDKATNSVLVTDTRVYVWYEDCEPKPASPTSITVLGGTVLPVLPTAQDAVAKFRPGQQMTLLLTADGKVASAISGASGNATAVISDTGKITMLCGTGTIDIKATAEEKYFGTVATITGTGKNKISLYNQTTVAGNWDRAKGTVGTKSVEANVMLYKGSIETAPSAIEGSTVYSSRIRYTRTNWRGKIDLIVLKGSDTTELFGRVKRTTELEPDYDISGNPITVTKNYTTVYWGEGADQCFGPVETGYGYDTGSFVAFKKDSTGIGISYMTSLTRITGVSAKSWIGKTAVAGNGATYTVPATVACYNKDNDTWISLEKALDYSATCTLYVKDGVVRIVEVKA